MTFLFATALRLSSAYRRSANFMRDTSGSMGLIFALAAAAAAFSLGAAIDYSRAVGGRARLQAAVDQAMLAAAQAPAAQRASRAATILQASLASSGISASWTTSPSANPDGSISGSVTATMPTTSLSLARISQMTMKASATAKMAQQTVASPANLAFTLTGASGWYWKEVDLYIHQPGDQNDTLVAAYFYQPTNLFNGGTGTVSALFNTGPNGTMVSDSVNKTVSLGSTYDKAYLVMKAYTDGCAPGYAPKYSDVFSNSNEWNPFTCLAVGSTWDSSSTRWVCSNGSCGYQTTTVTHTVGAKTGSLLTYSTDDAATAHNLFVNGTELPDNVKPNFFSLFQCGQTTTHDWEDTTWANPLPGSWSQQDIHFTITSTCAINANIVNSTAAVLSQ